MVATTLTSTFTLAMPAQVLIIRHAEKPEVGNGLSPKGFKRAKALVAYFKSNPAVTQFGTPVALFAMKPKDETGSIRAIQTLTPLSTALSININADYFKNDLDELIAKIASTPQYNGKTVLICWEHKIIPVMAQHFGVEPKPSEWLSTDFETVYVINFLQNKFSSFKKLREFNSDL